MKNELIKDLEDNKNNYILYHYNNSYFFDNNLYCILHLIYKYNIYVILSCNGEYKIFNYYSPLIFHVNVIYDKKCIFAEINIENQIYSQKRDDNIYEYIKSLYNNKFNNEYNNEYKIIYLKINITIKSIRDKITIINFLQVIIKQIFNIVKKQYCKIYIDVSFNYKDRFLIPNYTKFLDFIKESHNFVYWKIYIYDKNNNALKKFIKYVNKIPFYLLEIKESYNNNNTYIEPNNIKILNEGFIFNKVLYYFILYLIL